MQVVWEKLIREVRHWSKGIRFYIAVAIGLFTLESWWWAQTAYGGTVLFATRLEELYAWVAVTLLATAVSIGPVCSTWPKIPGKQLLYDARRLLGIGAFWFSLLHISISYASLFKFANPLTLPGTYQRAFAIGSIASLVLFAMAFTSFDKAFHGMGKWWFRLHRFVYAAIVFCLLHAFLIGTHATQLPELVLLSAVALFVLGLHVYSAFLRKKPSRWQRITIPSIALLLFITLGFGYSQHFTQDGLNGQTMNTPTPPDPLQEMQSMPGMQGMEMQEQ